MAERTTAVQQQLDLARASLKATEQHFRLLVESVRDYAIFMLDPEGRVATWNAGAQRIKQYAASEIVGRHFSTFYTEEDIRSGKCEIELEGATLTGRYEDEGWRKRKDGTLFWANVVITALRDESNILIGFAKVTRDLTDRKRAEEEQIRLATEQRAREAADAANRAKDDFIAHVSHELRTPLNAILGWSRLLNAGGLEEERRVRALATVERNAESMTRIIDDLLDVSRIISGKMRLAIDTIDVHLVIERAAESVRLSAEEKGVRILLLLESRSAGVVGDSNRLQQVIWNLLTNAIKFTPKRGYVSIALRESDPKTAEIIVEDSGSGVAPEKLKDIFEPFYQAGAGPATGGRGLGLGLAISRKIVELHGGTIKAESEGEGRGTKFIVCLPLAAAYAEVETKNAKHSTATPPPPPPSLGGQSLPQLAGLKVLVVEDHDDARELVRVALEAAGSIVFDAADVGAAMAILEAQPIDVLLSDIGLPGENGYDLIRRVRTLTDNTKSKIPAAAMTAYVRGEDRIKALAAGYALHIAKPVEPHELLMVVASLASRK